MEQSKGQSLLPLLKTTQGAFCGEGEFGFKAPIAQTTLMLSECQPLLCPAAAPALAVRKAEQTQARLCSELKKKKGNMGVLKGSL